MFSYLDKTAGGVLLIVGLGLAIVGLLVFNRCSEPTPVEEAGKSRFKYDIETVEHEGHKFMLIYSQYGNQSRMEKSVIPIHHPGCPCLEKK